MTKQLSKNEEKDINNEIMVLKRKIREAEFSGNIEIKLEQAEDLKDELDELISKIKAEKEPIDKEYLALRDELDKKNKHITELKGVRLMLSRKWLLRKVRKPRRKNDMTSSMRLGRKIRRNALTSSQKRSTRSELTTTRFGTSITRKPMIIGNKSNTLTSSSGKPESRTEKSQKRKEKPKRQSTKREIKKEKKRLSFRNTLEKLNS